MSMLKLIASAPGDGWAFVEKDQQIVIIRPPYQQWTLTPAPEGAVEKAVQHHGFVAQERTFADWDSLIAHLREQFLAVRREQGSKIPDSEQIRSLLHLAPDYMLAKFLDRVESELLPQGELQHSMKLLTYLLGVEAVKASSTLYYRTVQLLIASQKAMRIEETWKLKIAQGESDLQRKFPQALRTYGIAAVQNLAESVSRRGQVFALA
jgi:hypothetical protein